MCASNLTTIPAGYKRCSSHEGCQNPNGPILPLSEFGVDNSTRTGRHGYCNDCRKAQRAKSPNHLRAVANAEGRAALAAAGLKHCCRGNDCVNPDGPYLPCSEFSRSSTSKDGYSFSCKQCLALDRKIRNSNADLRAKMHEANRIYRESHRENDKIRHDRYQQSHREELRAKSLHYRNTHLDQARESFRKWQQNNRDKAAVRGQRRAARARNLRSDYTIEDWNVAVAHWHGCCAVCGRPVGLWHKLASDHWIPLTNPDCPGTVPWNIVPLCHGTDGCNNSKRNRDPKEWILQKLGQRKGAAKLKEIEAFLEQRRRERE